MAKFSGVYPALITPVKAGNKVDVPALEKLMGFHKQQHSEGFYIGGATGEGLLLDKRERMILAEKACEFAGKDAKKIVHIASINMEETIELAKQAEAAGADAISAIPPIYFAYTDDEVYRYYKAIAEAVHIPLIIYYTMAANLNISLKQFEKLFQVENIEGVKWTNPNFYRLILLRQACPDITIFNGPDEMLVCGLAAGCDGGIGSTYNFMLPTYQGIYNAFKSGNVAEALELQKKADRIIEVCLRSPWSSSSWKSTACRPAAPARPCKATTRRPRPRSLQNSRRQDWNSRHNPHRLSYSFSTPPSRRLSLRRRRNLTAQQLPPPEGRLSLKKRRVSQETHP